MYFEQYVHDSTTNTVVAYLMPKLLPFVVGLIDWEAEHAVQVAMNAISCMRSQLCWQRSGGSNPLRHRDIDATEMRSCVDWTAWIARLIVHDETHQPGGRRSIGYIQGLLAGNRRIHDLDYIFHGRWKM